MKISRVDKLPASVMFGGPDLDLPFVTTMDPTLLRRPPEDGAGHPFAIEGLGEPRHAG